MGTARLSGYTRNAIKQALLDRAFGVREAELKEAREELGRAVYDVIYPATLRQQMQALPKGFLPEAEGIGVSFDGDFTFVEWGGERRIANDHDHAAADMFGPRHVLTKRFLHLQELDKKLRADRKAAGQEAWGVLGSCSTVAALLKRWPEVEPIVRQVLPSSAPPQLPALPLKQLNKTFGLPVAGAAP